MYRSQPYFNYLLKFAALITVSMQFDVQRLSGLSVNEALGSFGNILTELDLWEVMPSNKFLLSCADLLS